MVKALGSITDSVTWLGATLIAFWAAATELLTLFAKTLFRVVTPPFRPKELIHQIYFAANQSLSIVVFCVSFAAAITVIESSYHMKIVIQNDSLVPGFATLLILRELGAVLAALLVTSRVGAGYAAEVGSMKVTEQIDALKMLSIDPIRYLVVPRFLACVIGGMALTVISNVVCIFFSMIISMATMGYGSSLFIVAMNRFVSFQDLAFSVIKGGCLGAIIPIVSCFYGFRCEAGAEGVGHATTDSVVTSSVLIIIVNFILTWTFSHFY